MNIFKNLFNKNLASKQPPMDIRLIDSIILKEPEEAIEALNSGANPNSFYEDKLPAIYLASNRDYYDLVRLLIRKGANVNAKGSSKKSEVVNGFALLTTCARGNLAITKLLVENNADINNTEHTGLTPLMSAAFKGHNAIVEFLIIKGAAIEQKDQCGYTALMFAANAGQYDCVKTLLDNEAIIDASDKDESTPIMFAAQHGHNEIVKLLLQKGADKYKKGKHGLNAVDFAKQNGLSETIEIFEENNWL